MTTHKFKSYTYDDLDSTNDKARELLSEQETKIVVTAEYQNKGRGRNQKAWVGKKGENIFMSLGICSPKWSTQPQDYQIIGCLAVQRAIEAKHPKIQLRIKYPNDIFANELGEWKKISGVLIENEFRGTELNKCIVGIGININQKAFDSEQVQSATSLYRIVGIQTQREEIIDLVLTNIDSMLDDAPQTVFENWCNELGLIGKTIVIIGDNNRFEVRTILRDGRLCLQNIQTNEELIMDTTSSIRYEL